jgi:hypothetical protein
LIDGQLSSFLLLATVVRKDVVGVPSTQTLQNLQYMGRIRLPRLEFADYPVELDHWANWFFHVSGLSALSVVQI